MSQDLDGKTILIVEDDYLLASDMAGMLRAAGARVCGPFSDAGDGATQAIKSGEAQFAFVDINLGHGPTFVVAELLRARGTPFAFVTGYETVPLSWRDVPMLKKPVHNVDVVRLAKCRAAPA